MKLKTRELQKTQYCGFGDDVSSDREYLRYSEDVIVSVVMLMALNAEVALRNVMVVMMVTTGDCDCTGTKYQKTY